MLFEYNIVRVVDGEFPLEDLWKALRKRICSALMNTNS